MALVCDICHKKEQGSNPVRKVRLVFEMLDGQSVACAERGSTNLGFDSCTKCFKNNAELAKKALADLRNAMERTPE
jgi:hypothetical protein